MNVSDINWAALRAPFDPIDVDFRLQSVSKNDESKGIAIAYMDARCVQDRLDDVVGPENWSFTWEPIAVKDGKVVSAKGTLTICGVSKSDIGDGDQTETSKASVSDCLKRAAVQWGIGRYLYSLGTSHVAVKKYGNTNVIDREEVARLRAQLPKPEPVLTAKHITDILTACDLLGRTPPTAAQFKQMTAADALSLLTQYRKDYQQQKQEATPV